MAETADTKDADAIEAQLDKVRAKRSQASRKRREARDKLDDLASREGRAAFALKDLGVHVLVGDSTDSELKAHQDIIQACIAERPAIEALMREQKEILDSCDQAIEILRARLRECRVSRLREVYAGRLPEAIRLLEQAQALVVICLTVDSGIPCDFKGAMATLQSKAGLKHWQRCVAAELEASGFSGNILVEEFRY